MNKKLAIICYYGIIMTGDLMRKRNYVLLLIVILLSFVKVYAEGEDCVGIFGQDLINEIKGVLDIIRIVAPIILLLLTSLDFAKVVFSDSKDGLDKAKNNFLKRAVAVLIIFFAPNIIELILTLVDNASMSSCANAIK